MTSSGQNSGSAAAYPLRTRARIAAHVLWDHLVQPPALAGDDVPWRAEGITPEWLTAILCSGVPGAAVEAIEVDGGSQGSTVRFRIAITYNEAGRLAGLPEHLFAKSTPSLLTRLSAGMAASAEARFLQHVRPDLPIEAPTLRHAAYDRITGRSVHLFDDLVATKGATFCGPTTRITRDHAEQMVDTLAVLHGRFLGSSRFESDLRWVPTYETFLRTGERNGIRVGHDKAMIEARDVIPPEVFDRRAEIWPMTIKSLALHEQEPRTLIHSDVHLGNWYIVGGDRMGLGDWQCVSTGHWARDFAYAVSTVLAEDDRRAWERDLLDRYLQRMRDQAGLRTTLEVGWNQYRQQLFAALLMWTPTLCHPPTMPDMQPPEMSRLMIQRITTAIADLDALSSQEP